MSDWRLGLDQTGDAISGHYKSFKRLHRSRIGTRRAICRAPFWLFDRHGIPKDLWRRKILLTEAGLSVRDKYAGLPTDSWADLRGGLDKGW